MKKILSLLLLTIFLIGCKKDTVDATDTQTFQSSINDMASSLTTLEQVKFNEALYILKKFAVSGNDDVTELKQLGKLLEGKNVQQIFALADETASKNGMDWKSNGPPMLGGTNIFGSQNAKEADPNDIAANGADFQIKSLGADSISGTKGLQIVPFLTDATGRKVNFNHAALETSMEVSSAGRRLSTSKNLMTDSNFRGFRINFSSLNANAVQNGKIDIKVTIKTAKQAYSYIKTGILVNPKALHTDVPKEPVQTVNPETPVADPTTNPVVNPTQPSTPGAPPVKTGSPATTVQKFLNNLSSQNLKAAFDMAENPNWGSYDSFSNENTGFGAVKNIDVKKITPSEVNQNSAKVDAVYNVTDKFGKTVPLNVTFGLTNKDGNWKISSYKIK